MHFGKIKNDEQHKVYLDSRAEAFRVARVMGLLSFSGLKLLGATLTEAGGRVGMLIDTADLQAIDARLEPPCEELRAYLGNLALPLPETVNANPTSDTMPLPKSIPVA